MSQSNLETRGDKIVIDCLKAMSASCEIREAWEGICKRKFLIEVHVAECSTAFGISPRPPVQ